MLRVPTQTFGDSAAASAPNAISASPAPYTKETLRCSSQVGAYRLPTTSPTPDPAHMSPNPKLPASTQTLALTLADRLMPASVSTIRPQAPKQPIRPRHHR